MTDQLKKESNQQQVGEQLNLIPKKRKEMSSLERVQLYQRKLYLKAKQEKQYGFYVLYDKLFLPYVLEEAWKRVKTNGGSAGVDGITIKMIEESGVEEFLKNLSEELRQQTYQASAVKRVWIPKSNGGQRPLGIPTLKDRVSQMACLLVIEPIFEADFEEHSYGFRPKRSAHDAITKIKEHLNSGKTEVYDADLSKYFDTIPHDKLMIVLKERIKDQRMLKLIKKWLKAPVYDDGQYTGGKNNKVGTPQGGVISPLLSNLYLHLLDKIVNMPTSIFKRLQIAMVRYADDFVLMGKKLKEEALDKLRKVLDRMELKLNEEKSKQINAKETPFNFLGFVFRHDKSFKNPQGGKFWNVKASEKSNGKIRDKIKETLKQKGHYKSEELVSELNAIVRGWLNYFEIKGVSYSYAARRELNGYMRASLTRYFNRKSQRKSRLYRKQAFKLLVEKFGLIDPLRYSTAM
jgi:group II intron reverse transcriptase/maturase